MLSLSHTPRAELLAVKRAMDVAGAVVLLVVLAPVMLGVAVAIKLTSRGPVLFAQDRYGYMKRLFRMYKFRTMVADAEQLHAGLEERNEASGPVFKIRDDPRITWVGRVLRRTSLDELPQLWHVLTGEMSLVGPRPLPTRDVGLFPEPWLMRRFSVRPGLTCLVADQRAEQAWLQSMDRPRPSVHRQLVVVARSEDSISNPVRADSRNGSVLNWSRFRPRRRVNGCTWSSGGTSITARAP